MKQLTIKKIAPYLPYEVKITFDEDNPKLNWNIMSAPHLSFLDGDIIGYRFKPILRPLSDLIKTTIYNGEETPYIIILTHLAIENNYFNGDVSKLAYLTMPSNRKHIMEWPYWLLEKLFEWHFDVFGLIPDNLAVDINTLNQ